MENDPLLGIPDIFKGPLGKVVAIDMNTGEHLWMIPHGDMATRDQENFRNNPLLKGLNIDTNWGRRGHPALAATSTLLLATGQTADNRPHLFGIDKKTGKRVGQVPTPPIVASLMARWVMSAKPEVVLDPAANALGLTVSNFGRGVVGERL